MHAALLVLSSAVGAGPDVVPIGWGEKPPVVVPAGGCHNCGPAAGHAHASAPATGCCDPCATGSAGRMGLLDRIKARFGGRKSRHADCGCASAYSPAHPVAIPGCATPLPHGAVPAHPAHPPATPPKEMPKGADPKDGKDPKTPKELPKGAGTPGTPGAAALPVAPPAVRPTPVNLPAIPVAPMAPPLPSAAAPY